MPNSPSDAAIEPSNAASVPRSWSIGAALVLVAAVALAFAPAFRGHLLDWDDHATLVYNRAWRGLGLEQLRWMFTTAFLGPYQPLSWLSFALDRALWGFGPGFDPPQAAGFHATNIVLQAIAAVACLAAALRLFELAAPSVDARLRLGGASLAALWFAVHPLRVESVAWVTERRDVLSGSFFMLALNAWLRSKAGEPAALPSAKRAALGAVLAVASVALFFLAVDLNPEGVLRWGALGPAGLIAALFALAASTWLLASTSSTRARWSYIACVACFLLALLSKGLAMVLPAMLLVLDVWPLRRASVRSAWPAVVEKLPLFALAVVFAALAMWGQRSMGETVVDWSAHTPLERMLQACHSLAHYSLRTFVPVGLLPIYDLPDDLRFSETRFWLSVVAVVVVTSAFVAWRRRWPGLLAAWLAFAIAIAPVSGLTQAGPQLAADRYSYLSCWPFAWLAAGAWMLWTSRARSWRLALGVAAAVTLALGVLTFRHTRMWRDSESLWTYTLAHEPDSAIALAQLATCRAAAASEVTDRDRRTALLTEVERMYARSLALDATPNIVYLREWGKTLVQLGRCAEAIDPLTRYVAAREFDPAGLLDLGTALRAVGRARDALPHLEMLVRLDPDSANAWTQLGLAREDVDDRAGAIAAFERVAKLWPKHAATREKLQALKAGH